MIAAVRGEFFFKKAYPAQQNNPYFNCKDKSPNLKTIASMRFFLERTLKRLEREGNDDLLQIRMLGPEFFPTPDLYELLEKLERQRDVVDKKQYHLKCFGMLLPLFIIGAFLSNYFTVYWLGVALLAGIPMIFGFLMYHAFRIKQQYPTFHDTHHIERSIRQELKRRREESSIF